MALVGGGGRCGERSVVGRGAAGLAGDFVEARPELLAGRLLGEVVLLTVERGYDGSAQVQPDRFLVQRLGAVRGAGRERDEGERGGTAGMEIYGIPSERGAEGSVTDGVLEASWEGDLYGQADVEGVLEVTRINRSIAGVE